MVRLKEVSHRGLDNLMIGLALTFHTFGQSTSNHQQLTSIILYQHRSIITRVKTMKTSNSVLIQLFTAYTTLSAQVANEQLRNNSSHINKHGIMTENENSSIRDTIGRKQQRDGDGNLK